MPRLLVSRGRPRAALGVTPATDTSTAPPSVLNKPLSIAAVVIAVVGIGALVYLTEKDG